MFEGKIETVQNMIAENDDSLLSDLTGKLQTGFSYHSQYNSDTIHVMTTDRHSRECYPADWRPRCCFGKVQSNISHWIKQK